MLGNDIFIGKKELDFYFASDTCPHSSCQGMRKVMCVYLFRFPPNRRSRRALST
jgi:hypothetical protein